MKVSRFAVARPVFTIMVVLIVILLGGVSLVRLPIDLMPDITYPTLSITCAYENASPEEIEELITRPIEEAISSVPGVEEITSTSVEGSSSLRVTFSWGTDLAEAAADIRDYLDRVRLPEDVDRPRLRKFDLASFPILIMGASSRLDPIQMREIVEKQIKYRVERIPGVAAMDIHGGLEREIHVNLDANKIRALGLRLDDVMRRIREGNVNLPAGVIQRGNLEVTIRVPGTYVDLSSLRETVVAYRQGRPIQLKEIALVADAWQKITRVVRVNGESGLRVVVNKRSGQNTVEVARAVLEEVERINRDIPQIRLTPIIDTSDYIERSITNVGTSAVFGGLLAVVVLLVFLRNIRSTVVIATAIPVSIIATFMLMYFGGFTLNIMTLGGLALGIGMLVDNAIVVLENIHRLRETGLSADRAAVAGSEEVASAIIASTLTTVVVFLPLIFMRGMAGVMFKQLSMVVGFALLCSLAVALTLAPMLSARILPERGAAWQQRHGLGGRLFRITGRLFDRLENGYKGLLHVTLRHRVAVTIGAVLLLAGSLALIPLVGVELMPSADEGEVRVEGEMAVGTRLGVVDATFRRIEDAVRASVPEIDSMVAMTGGSPWRGRGGHTGQVRVSLKPQAERTRSSEQIAADLRRKLRDIPGIKIRTRAGQGLFLLRMGSSDADKIQVEIRGYDLDVADELARQVERVVLAVPGVTDTTVSRETGTPEDIIAINRARADDQRVSVSDVANLLQTVLSGTRASDFRQAGDEYVIRVQLADAETRSLREILDLTLPNADGEPIVLSNVVDVKPRSGPVRIERKNQQRLVTVSANITGRDMGSVLADVREGLRAVPVPKDFAIVFGGDYEEQQKAFRELLLSFVLALILVYMVMACQFESLRDPFVVMFSVPFAAIGVIAMLFFSRTTFNVQSFIGCIMLGGIVVNNAILLVDTVNRLRRDAGMPLREAIEEGGRRRLRPILMTALTTSLALVPLALGLGEGGEAQAPLARAVIGGLISSSLITLVFVPVVYSIFERRAKPGTAAAATQEGQA